MKQTFADKLKKGISTRNITAYLIFSSIILVFVFFGLPSEMGGGAGFVAKVNSTFISVADYQQEEQRIQQYYNNMFGGGFDFSSQRQLLQQQAVESLVRSELVFQASKKEGVLATDAEVRDFIVKDIPAFQQNGFFQREFYSRYLEGTRTTPGEFENKVRKDILNLRMRRMFEATSMPLSVEEQKLAELKKIKVNFTVARIEDAMTQNLAVGSDEINKALAEDEFLSKAKKQFESTKAEYEQPEQVRAQHILIKAAAGDANAEQAALKKIQELQAKAQSQDFGKLAAEFSEDPGSKAQAGDLGFFSKGRMVPEFENAAFSLAVGKVSEPVKTNYGYHLIKVTEKKEASVADFDKVKQEVAKKILSTEKAQKEVAALEAALGEGDENKVNLLLSGLGAKWEETGDLGLGDDNWAKLTSANARDAAMEASQKQPLVKRLVRDGAIKYVIKLKSVKTDEGTAVAAASGSEKELAQKRRAEGLFEAWMNQYRANSDVELNTQLFRSMN